MCVDTNLEKGQRFDVIFKTMVVCSLAAGMAMATGLGYLMFAAGKWITSNI